MKLTKRDRKILAAREQERRNRLFRRTPYGPYTPGEVVQLTGRAYRVAKDGSFRRLPKAA